MWGYVSEYFLVATSNLHLVFWKPDGLMSLPFWDSSLDTKSKNTTLPPKLTQWNLWKPILIMQSQVQSGGSSFMCSCAQCERAGWSGINISEGVIINKYTLSQSHHWSTHHSETAEPITVRGEKVGKEVVKHRINELTYSHIMKTES